jgi:hypothetical protein
VASVLHPKLQELWHIVRSGGEPNDELLHQAIAADRPELAEALIEIVEDLQPSVIAETILDVVAHTLGDIRQLGGQHDLLLPADLEPLLAAARPAGIDLDSGRLQALASVEVPGLEGLQVEDAVAIRQASEAFEQWRARLSIALDRSRAVAAEQGGYLDSRRVIAETMADARAALFDEQRASGFLSRL